MKNKISDLRNHMFAQLERLSNEDLTPEELDREIKRAQAISEVGKVVVESAKSEIMFAKLTGKKEAAPFKFLEDGEEEKPLLARPSAEYSNKQHVA